MSNYFGFEAEALDGIHTFISYSNDDSSRVGLIAKELHNLGLMIWYDRGILCGTEWEIEIMSKIRTCKQVLVFLTFDLFQRESSYVLKENRIAIGEGKRVYYIFLDNIWQLSQSSISLNMVSFYDDLKNINGVNRSIYVYNQRYYTQIAKEIFTTIQNDNLGVPSQNYHSKASNNFSKSDNNIHSTNPSKISVNGIRIGSFITFGRYLQGEKKEYKSISWKVLDIQPSKMLIITQSIIEILPYDERDIEVTWETCYLRSWLNNVFITKAFTENERQYIVPVTNSNADNLRYGTAGGNPTIDRVFLLSVNDLWGSLSPPGVKRPLG